MYWIYLVACGVATAFALPPHTWSGPDHKGPVSSEWTPSSTHGTDALAREGMLQLERYHRDHRDHHGESRCSLKTAPRRKEWDALMVREKQAYIRAVKCLQTKPAISGDLVPGARNRTGNFLTWHRYFVHTYEKALREECGYKGYQPYVNWGRYSNSVIGSPIFDGSETSLSDNGAYSPHKPIVFRGPNNTIPPLLPGQGGGCVQNGPFKNYTTNLGPVALPGINTTAPNPRKDGFGFNPRCMKRDLSVVSASAASDFNSTKLIAGNNHISGFQNEMQGLWIFGIPEFGVHAGGHYMVSGDPGGDFYISPGDPWFWFHHAQIDRTYWIWQNLGLPQRLEQVAGTITMLNVPPSRNATLSDRFDLGVNDNYKGLTIKEAMTTTGGPFCYVYE